jgi:hypothetical protein
MHTGHNHRSQPNQPRKGNNRSARKAAERRDKSRRAGQNIIQARGAAIKGTGRPKGTSGK